MEGVDEEVSNEVDKRIIEMEFKNEQFEKHASQTLSTLDKLKAKLNDNFSTKGPEQLNKAIQAVDVSPVSRALDTVQVQFNALQIAGKRVIENIVDAAMSGIANVKNKLTGVVEQIKVGGSNRAQNIEQAKFMLQGFGIEWAQIEADISYGVQDTAYGLDAAAKVASQLVASNVQLGDDMKNALRGISGVAAMTNSTYEDIGRIFTQVAGQGRLMGDQLLQLSGRGINAAATLAQALNKTEAEVRDMTSKGQIDFKTFATAMDNAFGQHAKDANKTFSGALSNTKAALSRLGADIAAQRFTTIHDILVKIIPQLKALKTAMKPVEDGINSAMEALGRLAEYLIERINVTAIVESVTPKILRVTDTIKEFANTAREYIQKLDNSKPAKFVENLTKTADTVKEIVDFTKEEIELAQRIWNVGDLGIGEERVRNVEALGQKYERVQAAVDKFIESGHNWDAVVTKSTEDTEKSAEAVGEFIGPVVGNQKPTAIYLIIDSFYNLLRVVRNIAGSGKNVLKVIFNSLTGTFGDRSILEGINSITSKIADLSDKFYISETRANKLRPIFDALFTVLKIGAKVLLTAAKAVGSIALFLADLINKAKDSKIIRGIFEAIGNAIRGVAKGLENLYLKLKESGVWDKFVEILKSVATWIGEKIIDGLNKFGDIASSIGEGVGGIFEKLTSKIKNMGDETERGKSWLDKIKDFFKEDILNGSWLTKLKDLMTDIFGSGKDVFQRAFNIGSDFVNGLIQGIKNLDQKDLDLIVSLLTKVALTLSTVKWLWSMVAVNKSFTKMTTNFTKLLETIGVTIKKYGQRADAERFKMFATSVAIIVGSIVAVMITIAALEHYNFDAERILKMARNMVLIIVGIVGAISIVVTWLSKASNITGNTTNILGRIKTPTLALTVLGIGYLMKTVMSSFTTMYGLVKDENFDSKAATKVAVTLGLLLVGLIALTGLAIKFTKTTTELNGLGLAFALISIGILLSSLTKSFKKVLEAVKGTKKADIESATSVINSFLIPILIFAAAVALLPKLIDKIPGGSTSANFQTNPFKGMFGMLIGLAALLRFGFMPLLEALSELHKEGKSGEAAISSFKSIVNSLMIFIGAVTLIIGILDRVVTREGKNIGSEFVDGKYVGEVKGKGFFTSSKSGLMWGLVGIVVSLAAMFYTISLVMKNMKGVDKDSIRQFKEMSETILVIAGILAVIGGVLGAVDKTGGAIFGLLAIAAVIASVAAVMLGAGYGFKAFEEALRDLIESLPSMTDSLLAFFESIKENKEDIVNGITETVQLFFDGITAAVVAWSEGLSKSIPTMIEAIFDCLIVTLNGVADQLFEKSQPLVDAADRFALGFLYFLGIALQKVQQRFKELLVATLGKAQVDVLEFLFPGLDVDYSEDKFEYTGPTDLEDYRKEYRALLGKDTNKDYFYNNYYKQLSDELRDTTAPEIEPTEFMGYQLDVDKYINQMADNIGAKLKTADFSKLKEVLSMDNITSMISDGNFGDIESIMGEGFNIESIEGMWDDLDLTTEAGINELNNRIEGFMNTDSSNWEEWADGFFGTGQQSMEELGKGIDERMMFVTEITSEAAQASIDEMNKYESKFYEVGVHMAEGFAKGIQDVDSTRRINSAATSLVEGAEQIIRETAEVNSPSRVFMRLGRFITLGFAEGISNSVSVATLATQEAGEAAILSMRETIQRASLEAAEGIDSPRITPILDMSNITEGMNSINGMFDTTRALRLATATSGEARSATNRRFSSIYQNGSNFDDTNTVNAINSLNSEVSTLKDAISGMQVVIDSRALVGQIATPMDRALGKRALAGRRGI